MLMDTYKVINMAPTCYSNIMCKSEGFIVDINYLSYSTRTITKYINWPCTCTEIHNVISS